MTKNYVWGALLLSFGAIGSKIIGAFYKIPLANILGSGGIGMYYLVFPIYALSIVICSSGVVVSVSRNVAQTSHKSIRKTKAYLWSGVFIALVQSCVMALVIVLISSHLSKWQAHQELRFAYMLIAPAIVVSSLLAVFKAYFQGLQNMVPSTITMLTQQVVKLVVGITLAKHLLRYGIMYAVFGAIASVTISELIGLLFVLVLYFLHRHKQSKMAISTAIFKPSYNKDRIIFINAEIVDFGVILRQTFKQSFACMCTYLVLPVMAFVDSMIIVKLLIYSSVSVNIATSLYGIQSGIVTTLIALPVLFAVSLSTVALSKVSNVCVTSINELSYHVTNFVKITLIVAIPCAVVMYILTPNIVTFLYGNSLSNVAVDEFSYACVMLRISCVSIIYLSLTNTCISLLQAVGENRYSFNVMLCGFFIRFAVLITLILYTKLNIYSVIIADTIFTCITCVFCMSKLNKKYGLNMRHLYDVLLPIFASIIAGTGLVILLQKLSNFKPIIVLSIGGFSFVIVYFVIVFIPTIFSKLKLLYKSKN